MIRGFELTGDLGITPGKGRRPIAPENVEEVTIFMAKHAACNVRSSSSEVRTLRPAFSALVTITSTISCAIGVGLSYSL